MTEQKSVASTLNSQSLSPLKNKGKGKKKATVAAPPPPAEHSEEEDDDDAISERHNSNFDDAVDKESDNSEDEEDSEDEGVDQEGMERLMKLLGEDGLDDFDRSQLRNLVGEEEDSEEDEGDNDCGDEEGAETAEEDEEDESGSDEDQEMLHGEKLAMVGDAESDEENEEQDDAIPLDEVDSIDEDAVPQQKLEIDNKVALERIRQNIQLDPSLPWTETLVVTYPQKIEADVDDDLNRELSFYKQALHSAQTARTLAAKHNFAFTRPSDYFAEMVKSDAHMERIRQRLLNENAGIKKSEEKRREREGKKFGKQVQIEKLKEREKSKKEMEERLKNLKRKRKDMLDNAQGNRVEDFDVTVEDAISDRPSKRNKSSEGDKKARIPRQARDKKYGFGGAGRRSKQNTKESTDNFGPGAGRGKKGKGGAAGKGGKGGKKQRPGKSKRVAARSKS